MDKNNLLGFELKAEHRVKVTEDAWIQVYNEQDQRLYIEYEDGTWKRFTYDESGEMTTLINNFGVDEMTDEHSIKGLLKRAATCIATQHEFDDLPVVFFELCEAMELIEIGEILKERGKGESISINLEDLKREVNPDLVDKQIEEILEDLERGTDE